MRKILLFSVMASLTVLSCKKSDTTTTGETVVVEEVAVDTTTVDGSTAESALDWAGTYTAELPCANCPGILTEVVLNADNTFTVTSDYVDNPTNKLTDSGTIVWYGNGNFIETKGSVSTKKYKVIENGLIQLDEAGNEITSNMKEFYVFKKK